MRQARKGSEGMPKRGLSNPQLAPNAATMPLLSKTPASPRTLLRTGKSALRSVSGFDPLQRSRMLRHLFAINDSFATGRDRIGVLESNRQRVHVGFLYRINPSVLVEVEFDRFAIR